MRNNAAKPTLYYKDGEKLTLEEYNIEKAATAEFLLRPANKSQNSTLSLPAFSTPQIALEQVSMRAKEYAEENWQNLPVLMDYKLFQEQKQLLAKNDDLTEREFASKAPRFGKN